MPANGPARSLPEWAAPPQMIGGHVTGPALVGRSDQAVVALRQVLAFPSGVEAELEGHYRGPIEEPNWHDATGRGQLRFWVRFPDGREAAQGDKVGARNGRGPVLAVINYESGSAPGREGHEDVRVRLWIWPLPPPGPLVLSCSWPGHSFDDVSLVLDGGAIHTAAAQARQLWPSAQ